MKEPTEREVVLDQEATIAMLQEKIERLTRKHVHGDVNTAKGVNDSGIKSATLCQQATEVIQRLMVQNEELKKLLSAVMDANSGMDFDDYVRKHGFGPGHCMLAAQNRIDGKIPTSGERVAILIRANQNKHPCT